MEAKEDQSSAISITVILLTLTLILVPVFLTRTTSSPRPSSDAEISTTESSLSPTPIQTKRCEETSPSYDVSLCIVVLNIALLHVYSDLIESYLSALTFD